jgi:hypothetical protein
MDLIIEEERKSEGQKQKFIKLKSEVKTRDEKVEHVKNSRKSQALFWLPTTIMY